MDYSRLRPLRPLLITLAVIGFLIINVPFLYYAGFEKEVYAEAMSNRIAQVFMGEALLLMLFFAFLIAKLRLGKPGWLFFIIMSLVGSMAFSVPFHLYLLSRESERED